MAPSMEPGLVFVVSLMEEAGDRYEHRQFWAY